MAAPMARLFQKRGCWSGIAASLRHYNAASQQAPNTIKCKAFSPSNNQAIFSSTVTIDALAQRLATGCVLSQTSSQRQFSSLATTKTGLVSSVYNSSMPQYSPLLQSSPGAYLVQPKRTIIKYSMGKGKKKSVTAIADRFYRFNSGLWLRCRAGRDKKLWRKSPQRKRRIKQFVFCSGNQSKKLDKMVTSYWRRQKHIPEDPFHPFEYRNWYGYRKHPGNQYVNYMHEKNAPVNMAFKKPSENLRDK